MKYLFSFILITFSLTAFSQNYTYNKESQKTYLKKISNNKKMKSLLLQMEETTGKSEEFADKLATLAAMDQSHYPTMCLASIGYFANNGYLSKEEYSLLSNLFKKGGWNSKNIAKVQNYTNYSGEFAAEIISVIAKDPPPPTPTGLWRGSLKLGGVVIGAILGGATGFGPAGVGAGAAIGAAAGDALGEVIENLSSNKGGTGVLAYPDGQGDYKPSGGWPIVN